MRPDRSNSESFLLSGAPLRQKPQVESRILIGRIPRIVTQIGIDRQSTDLPAAIPDCPRHGKAAFGRDDVIAVAMERPDRRIYELACGLRIACAGNWCKRGKTLRAVRPQRQVAWAPRLSPVRYTRSGLIGNVASA